MKKYKTEQRSAARVNISSDLHFRPMNSDKFYEASCIDLSITGISFHSEHEFKVGEQVEVAVYPTPHIKFSTSFTIKIVRVELEKNGFFKMGANIEYEENDNQA